MRCNRLLFIVLVASFMLASCNERLMEDVNEPGVASSSEILFHASFGDGQKTKTGIRNETEIWWSPGDRISVFYGDKASGVFVSTNAEDAQTADFAGSISLTTSAGGSDVENPSFWAVYPYSEDSSCDSKSVSITLDSSQMGTNGSFASGTFPAIAQSSGFDLAFYNVCGGIAFTVTRDDIRSVTLTGNNKEILAGTVRVSFAEGLPAVQKVIESVSSITLTAPDNQTFTPGVRYYITSLPVTFSNGYRLTFKNSDGEEGIRNVTETKSINRSRFLLVNEADANVTFTIGNYEDLSAGGETANCYIVNGSGKYMFPIIKGNGADGVIISGDTANIEGATAAKVVWQEGSVIGSVGIYKGYLLFEVTSWASGNALLAVTDDNDNILWSWHIWSTDYRLGEGDIPVYNHEKSRLYHMMARTLGESGRTATMYQFGRKDPFPGRSVSKTMSKSSLEQSILHPDTYFTNGTGDWCTTARMDWWDEGCKSYVSSSSSYGVLQGKKTIYDPCPAGYRVPPDDAFSNFTTTGFNTSNESYINSSNPGMIDFMSSNNTYYFYTGDGRSTIPYRAFGGLSASAGTYLTNIAYYYGCSPSGYNISRLLQFYAGTVNPLCTQYSRALSGTIRPVRDNTDSSQDESLDGNVVQLQEHSEGSGVPIVIMGDGFTISDVRNGTYEKAMNKAYQYLFTAEPLTSLKSYFDVWSITTVSYSSSFNGVDTKFKSVFTGGSTIEGDDDLALKYAEKVVPSNKIKDMIILVVLNSTRYAGTCYLHYIDYFSYYSLAMSVAYVPMANQYGMTFEDVIHHEACGHGIGKLADEYSGGSAISSDAISRLLKFQDAGAYVNVDINSDVSSTSWSRLAADERFGGENLGAYEGAYTYAYGIYRPTFTSIMDNNKGVFNAPSRAQIYKRVMGTAYNWSWTFDYEGFVAFDSNIRQNMLNSVSNNAPGLEQPVSMEGYRLPSPVFVKDSPEKYNFQ